MGKLLSNLFHNVPFSSLALETNPLLALCELTSSFKPYEGEIQRLGKTVTKRFYDEREWRYTPFITNQEIAYRLGSKEFENDITKASWESTLGKKYVLDFRKEHIKYIIVKKEEEIDAMSIAVEQMKQRFNSSEAGLLQSRIISAQQIAEDF